MIELLRIFANVLLPVFGVVGVGGIVARRWSLDYRAMSTVAYRLLAPAFIFRLLSDPDGFDGPVIQMMAASVATVAGSWLLTLVILRRAHPRRRVLDAMAAGFGNVGNLGFPIVLFALGEGALDEAGIHFLAVTIGGFLLGVAGAARVTSGTPAAAMRRLVTTPALAVTPLALIFSLTGLTLPLFAGRFVDLLADAMIPVMLLTLGIQLSQARLTPDFRRLGLVAGVKLIAAPGIFALIAWALDLQGDARDAGLVLAAMPTAVLVGLISLEYELESETATAILLFTSAVSMGTLGVLLRFL